MIEKGKQPGSHLLSGAVVNPRALRALFRDRLTMEDIPNYGEVPGEAVYLLTRAAALRIPPPPTMRNHGNWIVSVSQLGRFLAEQAEAVGAAILPETDAHEAARPARTGASASAPATRAGPRAAGRSANFEPGNGRRREA